MKDITKEQIRGMKVIALDGDWAILFHEAAEDYYIGHTPCSRSWCPCSGCQIDQRKDKCCTCGEKTPEGLIMAMKLMKWK